MWGILSWSKQRSPCWLLLHSRQSNLIFSPSPGRERPCWQIGSWLLPLDKKWEFCGWQQHPALMSQETKGSICFRPRMRKSWSIYLSSRWQIARLIFQTSVVQLTHKVRRRSDKLCWASSAVSVANLSNARILRVWWASREFTVTL